MRTKLSRASRQELLAATADRYLAPLQAPLQVPLENRMAPILALTPASPASPPAAKTSPKRRCTAVLAAPRGLVGKRFSKIGWHLFTSSEEYPRSGSAPPKVPPDSLATLRRATKLHAE